MPTTLLSAAISYSRTLARDDSNGLTDAVAIQYANDTLMEAFKKLLERRADLFVQEAKRSITSAEIVGGAQPGRFLWPSDLWVLKELIINLQDPTSQDLWHTSDQVDVANLAPGYDFEWLRKNQQIQTPVHDNRGDWFEIFPTPLAELAYALKIHYFIAPTPYAATTDQIAYPLNLDANVIAYGIAAKYLRPLKPELADTYQAKAMEIVDLIIKDIGHGEQHPLDTKGLPLTGAEF